MSAIPKSSLSFYEQLVRTQHKTLLRLAVTLLSRKNKTPDIHRAEDAVQETFSIAWEKWDVLSTHPNPAGWLVITLKNVVKNMLREEQHWAEHLLQLPADITQPSPGADLELEGIVPPEDFLLLKRLYLYGETYEEVCQDLGIKKSALAMRVKRIKEQFRKNYMEIEKNFSSNSEQTAPTRHNTNRGGSKK